MNLEHIQQQVARDLKIDQNHLDSAAANVPILHSKYLQLFTESQLLCIKLQSEYDAEYKDKYLYYRNDYPVVLKNKAEIEVLISGDTEIQAMKLKLDYEKTCANYLEAVIKQINGMSFLIRDCLEFKKFENGM